MRWTRASKFIVGFGLLMACATAANSVPNISAESGDVAEEAQACQASPSTCVRPVKKLSPNPAALDAIAKKKKAKKDFGHKPKPDRG